jgi:hypothetical protein
MPKPSRNVMVMVPKPMPRLPSTSWATKPAATDERMVVANSTRGSLGGTDGP